MASHEKSVRFRRLNFILCDLKKLSVAILMALWVVTPARAQPQASDYFDMGPEQLLGAEVTSVSKRTEKLSEASAAIFIITGEDIQRSGVTTIQDALRMAPGVQVAQADSNSWAISIRGFNNTLANKLLVMIDGRAIYNPLFAGTYWELHDLMLSDIDRIEVIRGPGGALWGANAVNGVINIIRKKSIDTQGSQVSLLYGNEEKGTISARHGGSFSEDGYYRVYAKGARHDSSRRINGEDGDDDWENYRSGFRADWGSAFTLQGDIYQSNTDQLNSVPLLTSPYVFIEKETMRSRGVNVLGRWSRDYDDGSMLSVQSYIDYTSRDQILLEDRRTIVDTEVQYNFAPEGIHELTAGGGYRYVADDLGNAPTVIFSPAERQDNLFSAFLQDKITLLPDEWYLTLGSKFEHNDYTGFEFQPNARLEWLASDRQTLWAAISRAVRTPSRLEHDLDQTLGVLPPGTLGVDPAMVVLQGNGDFESEKMTAYEIGYRDQVTPSLSVDVTAFFNDYDRLSTVGFLPTSTVNNGIDPQYLLFPINAVNGMTGETYGLEIFGEWKVSEDWKLSVGYSYLDIFLHVPLNNGFDLETAEHQSPENQVNVRSYWNITPDWSLDTGIYYVDELEAGNVGDYVRLDMNLGYKINENLRFNLTGQNLLDNAHREFGSPGSLNAAEIPRSVFGKLTWKF